MKPVRIAVLGCGAVTEYRHLPALAGRHDCEVVALVDRNEARARRLVSLLPGSPAILNDSRRVVDAGAIAAIVCLPNSLHAPVSVALLEAGVHLLVEKPMAVSIAECEAMVQAAEGSGAVLAVGMTRRFVHAGRFARWAIEAGVLGRITSFDIRDGGRFNWPLASDFFFRKETAGGGVLIDTGVHTLDQLLWWLGDIEAFEYYDDNAGGVESECELRLSLKAGAQGIIELSRTRDLRNTAIIRGERGELEIGLQWNTLAMRLAESPWHVVGQSAPLNRSSSAQSQIDLIVAEHDDFLGAIHGRHRPEVDGRDARRCIGWIEACYRQRRPLDLPWLTVV